MSGVLQVTPSLAIPRDELRFCYARSSGPGGQNVNKLNTKALLRWPVLHSASVPDDVRQRFVARYRRRISAEGDVLIVGQRYRDAARNTADCLDRLREMLLAVATAPKRRRPTRPTLGSVRRRRAEKQHRSQQKSARRPPPAE